MSSTRDKLLDAALETMREVGLAALSARTVAARAQVNQALIFYHFGTVTELVARANERAVAEAMASYRDAFAAASTLSELLRIGSGLHRDQAAHGNVAVMAQFMAAGQQDAAYAAIARAAFDAWVTEVELVLTRILRGSILGELSDATSLARAVCAGFIGFELYEGIDSDAAGTTYGSMAELVLLADAVDRLGPVARAAVAATLHRTRSQ